MIADTPATEPAPHRLTTTPTDQAPAPVRTLLRKLPPGWHHTITAGHGTDQTGTMSADTDGNGKRHRVVREYAVDSWALRAHHPDGRQVRIVWAVEQGARTPAGRVKAPTFVLAWRGRHDGEDGPAPLAATEIPAYMAALAPAAALAAVEQVRAERAAKAAARRTGADIVELHPQLGQADETGGVAA